MDNRLNMPHVHYRRELSVNYLSAFWQAAPIRISHGGRT